LKPTWADLFLSVLLVSEKKIFMVFIPIFCESFNSPCSQRSP
jgi:hypothetical protein